MCNINRQKVKVTQSSLTLTVEQTDGLGEEAFPHPLRVGS